MRVCIGTWGISVNHQKPRVFLWKRNCVLVCDFLTCAQGRWVPKSQTSTHIVFLFCFVNNTLLICLVHSVHAYTLALGVHYGRFEKVACGPCHLVTIWERWSRGWSQSNGCVRQSSVYKPVLSFSVWLSSFVSWTFHSISRSSHLFLEGTCIHL